MSDILARILAAKTKEVAAARQTRPLALLVEEGRQQQPPRDFAEALRAKIAAEEPAVIAEMKKASPSRGVLRPIDDPAAIFERRAPAKSRTGDCRRASSTRTASGRVWRADAISFALAPRMRARRSDTMRQALPSFCVAATKSPSFFFAAPEAIASRARAIPSAIDGAIPSA